MVPYFSKIFLAGEINSLKLLVCFNTLMIYFQSDGILFLSHINLSMVPIEKKYLTAPVFSVYVM